ncbi:hypothetical protein [Nocardia sp. NRRL S-836]|uniref:hypothetical protein n=1 Tax=Nocardia sp. NRRL S-836 TaxID=1519492 RepID=UPI0006AF1661|nr:hypothetical protein [Nocardia sp. NRRL S-836]KOV85188.1 hypothetical protein ADL03_13270 [Nocardia sp. NRRL S-836]
MSQEQDDDLTMRVRDVSGNVVQGQKIDNVTVHERDRRTVVLLAVVLVVVLAAAAVIVWLVRKPEEPGKPALAAAVAFGDSQCRAGHVVPAQGQTSIPYARRPAGGVTVTGAELTATLQGLSEASVVLQSVRAEVLSRKPAMPGLFLQGRCASEVTRRFFAIDLSAQAPVATPVQDERAGQRGAPADFPLKVNLNDVEQLVIRVDSPREDVEWVLVVGWTSGGDSGELRIDDNGKPFRSTAVTAAQPWCVDEAQNVWKPC